MMTLEQVRHIARLARLSLSEREEKKMTEQLQELLEYFQKIKNIPSSALGTPMHPMALENVFREDRVTPSLPPQSVSQNAPAWEEGFFIVPKILDK